MVFDKQWFKQNQGWLLILANTWLGRRLLCINGDRSSVGKNRIIEIHPHAITWQNEDQLTTEFRTHDKFAKRLYYGLKPLWYVLHGWDMVVNYFGVAKFNLGFDTLIDYPDLYTGSNATVMGLVGRFKGYDNVGETFSTIRNSSGTQSQVVDSSWPSSDSDPLPMCLLEATGTAPTGRFNSLIRGAITFDTSVIATDAEISAASINVFMLYCSESLGTENIHITGVNLASNSDIDSSDYSEFGSTSYSAITSSVLSLANDVGVEFILNNSGVENITREGISSFGVRGGYDMNNSYTGDHVWDDAYTANEFVVYTVKYDGTTRDPNLVVNYSTPPSITGLSSISNISSITF